MLRKSNLYDVTTPSLEGRKGPLEKVFNILSCPLRGAIPIATRGLAGEGSGTNNKNTNTHY